MNGKVHDRVALDLMLTAARNKVAAWNAAEGK
jgi:hypothetical protein